MRATRPTRQHRWCALGAARRDVATGGACCWGRQLRIGGDPVFLLERTNFFAAIQRRQSVCFCWNHTLFLLEPCFLFAGTMNFFCFVGHCQCYAKPFFFVFAGTILCFCWNHVFFLFSWSLPMLCETMFFAGTILCFCWNRTFVCCNHVFARTILFLLEL